MSEKQISVRKFKVKGRFLMGKRMQPFTMDVSSINEDQAREKVLSDLGSRHRVKRNKVFIESIEEQTTPEQ